MATHRADVSVRFGVPDFAVSAVETGTLPLVQVPDVRLHSEAVAIAEMTRAGLLPGQRCPRPRPVSGRPEVVIGTHPRHGTLVRRGSRVDYDVAPGNPRDERATAIDDLDYVDQDTMDAILGPRAVIPEAREAHPLPLMSEAHDQDVGDQRGARERA